MGQLFGKDKRTISEHISNVFSEGELEENSTVRNFRTVQTEGNREVQRELDHFNLDVIIPVGYRVKSVQGTQSRIWATQRLKEHIIKGFTLNDDRFKSGSSMNYFNELQERIRKIRLSETKEQLESINVGAIEIIKLVTAILKSAKSNINVFSPKAGALGFPESSSLHFIPAAMVL